MPWCGEYTYSNEYKAFSGCTLTDPREKLQSEVHLFTQKLVNTIDTSTLTNTAKIKCIKHNIQYSVHNFSSESLVQSSVTYNKDKKQCTRTGLDLLYCVRKASSLHAACQAFSTRLTHAVSQYLVSMHAQPATTAHHSKGECHHALRAYRLHSTWPTDLALADTSVASSKNVL